MLDGELNDTHIHLLMPIVLVKNSPFDCESNTIIFLSWRNLQHIEKSEELDFCCMEIKDKLKQF